MTSSKSMSKTQQYVFRPLVAALCAKFYGGIPMTNQNYPIEGMTVMPKKSPLGHEGFVCFVIKCYLTDSLLYRYFDQSGLPDWAESMPNNKSIDLRLLAGFADYIATHHWNAEVKT